MRERQLDLLSFERLTVGEPTVSPKGFVTPYEIVADGVEERQWLVVRYEEELHGACLPQLAALASAVPALNYGLFTPKIEFRFPLAPAARAFLEEMLAITARDVFVHSLCRETGYLRPEHRPAPEHQVLREAIPRAELVAPTGELHRWNFPTSSMRALVLSSGGKESLLTYGLLRELGLEVYPGFVNESGGHWNTARLAYHHFRRAVPETVRVWSTVDRMYAFLNRNLKILRPNFQRVRSDVYPVQLFTFAHYIFSLLPIAEQLGIGNVCLGNEFDDPALFEEHGRWNDIPHHWGIYDQTQEFDLRMDRLFQEMGAGIRQWSAVRPLSGFLVQRILGRRYQELFLLQRSCHSTHVEKGMPLPCGTCSKCVGVLAYLLANDLDPRDIGYTMEHVDRLPEGITRGLKLDEDELAHTLWHLQEKGYRFPTASPARHDHVAALHIDELTSRLDNAPVQFRDQLFRLLLREATGGVRRDPARKAWIPFDPLGDAPALARPGVTPLGGPSPPRAHPYKASRRYRRKNLQEPVTLNAPP